MHIKRTHTISLAALFAVPFAHACSTDDRGVPTDVEETYQTSLQRYDSCSALERDLKDMLVAELETRFEQYEDTRGGASDDSAAPDDGSESGTDSGDRTEGEDYSGTNNQEDGVDEADLVKTDGYHLYVANGNALHIFGVPEFGDLEPVAEFPVEGTPRQLLIHPDAERVVVFSQLSAWSVPEDHPLYTQLARESEDGGFLRVPQLTKATVVDVSDHEEPTLLREVFVEGNYQTARLIDSSVRLGSFTYTHVPGLYNFPWYYWHSETDADEAFERAKDEILATELEDIVPTLYERDSEGGLEAQPLTRDSCADFHRPDNSHGRGFTSILSLDLLGGDLDLDAEHVVTNHPTLYASQDYLYVAEPSHDWWWFWWHDDHTEKLNIHQFDIQEPGQSTYLASGRVPGVLINQFSLGEKDGYLRVATTENMWGRWWVPDAPLSENHLFVLERDGPELREVGHVGGIAEGERIFAARFVGDKGYMVTFEQIDPLFTFDLSDPEAPTIVGELKIEGVSTYIHPIENDRLLTIGISGDEAGLTWDTEVSMFDVSDFEDPRLTDSQLVSSSQGWSHSEALYEHKAFQYWAPENLLAVPNSTWYYDPDSQTTEFESRLDLVTVDPESEQGAGLEPYGHVEHTDLFDEDDDYHWYRPNIRRSIFMGDFLYALSDRGITVHELGDLTRVSEAELPGRHATPYWR